MVYFAVFYKANQIRAKIIYALSPEYVVAVTVRQLDRSRNAISHVGFSIAWAAKNGKVVYQDKKSS